MHQKNASKSPTNELILSDELSIRYTISAFFLKENSVQRPTNQISMCLYSPNLKRHIGHKIQTKYAFTKKQAKKLKPGVPPNPTPPTLLTIEKSMIKLLEKNAGLSLKLEKSFKNNSKSYTLNETSLAVFWLHHLTDICDKYWESEKERANAQQLALHLLLQMGNFDLLHFINTDGNMLNAKPETELKSVCKELQEEIFKLVNSGILQQKRKRTSTPLSPTSGISDKGEQDLSTEETVTNRMKDYSKVLWWTIDYFLILKKVPQHKQIHDLYYAQFRHKPSRSRSISNNLVDKTLTQAEYRTLFETLTTSEAIVSNLNIAIILMLFVGLSAEEICGLNADDFITIKHYRPEHYLQITKEYQHKKGTYYLSNTLENRNQYRNVPLPSCITGLLSKRLIFREVTALLCDSNQHRLRPDILAKEMKKQFPPSQHYITLTSESPVRRLPLDFKPTYYKKSLESLWRLHGMQDSEIRYLRGRPQIETAGKHYIDFINPHKQYAMCLQMNHAMDSLLNADQPSNAPAFGALSGINNKSRSGLSNHTTHAQLHILKPSIITLSSSNGISIQTRGSK